MALSVKLADTISPSRRAGLISTPLYHGAEAASQTFKKGAPLVLDANGRLAVSPTSTPVTDVIIGFASEDGHNGTAGQYTMGYVPALPHILFEGVLEDATNFDHALAQVNLGMIHAIYTDATTGAWFLDENDSANGLATIVELVSPIGTVRGRVRFIVSMNSTIYA